MTRGSMPPTELELMANTHAAITDEQADLIRNAKVFFVASADPTLSDGPDGIGPVNLSPKGGTPLHVLDPSRVAWLDFGGSGNETARHAGLGGPVTLMICSFDQRDAAIVRLYGRAHAARLGESPLVDRVRDGVGEEPSMRERQVIVVDVERTLTSCGYSIPVLDFVRERGKEDRGRRYK